MHCSIAEIPQCRSAEGWRRVQTAVLAGTAAFEDFCDSDGIIEEGEKEDAIYQLRQQPALDAVSLDR
jgi:hypothetical protein